MINNSKLNDYNKIVDGGSFRHLAKIGYRLEILVVGKDEQVMIQNKISKEVIWGSGVLHAKHPYHEQRSTK